jgi:hypothetical protein
MHTTHHTLHTTYYTHHLCSRQTLADLSAVSMRGVGGSAQGQKNLRHGAAQFQGTVGIADAATGRFQKPPHRSMLRFLLNALIPSVWP